MTLGTLIEIAKWIIIAGNFIGMFSILGGITSPLWSPTGRTNNSLIELGINLLKYSVSAGLTYYIICKL